MRSIIWANSSFDVPVTTATMPLLWIEVLRVGIELISAFLRQRQNGAACLLADIRQAVQGAGDRADGVAGQAGKVFDRHMGYPLTAPAATPLMIYFWQNR